MGTDSTLALEIRKALAASYTNGLHLFARNHPHFQAMLNNLGGLFEHAFKEGFEKLGGTYGESQQSAVRLNLPTIKSLFEEPERFRQYIGVHYNRKFQSSIGAQASLENELKDLQKDHVSQKALEGLKHAASQFWYSLRTIDSIVDHLGETVGVSGTSALSDDVLNRSTKYVLESSYLYQRIFGFQQEAFTGYLTALTSPPLPDPAKQLKRLNVLAVAKIWNDQQFVEAYNEQRAAEIYKK